MRAFARTTMLVPFFMYPALASAEDDYCKTVGDAAEQVMSGRQNGVVMSTAVEIANEAPAAVGELLIHFIDRAYGMPLYPDGSHRHQAIVEFRNEIERECYNATR